MVTKPGYGYSAEQGHELAAEWLATVNCSVAVPGALFTKLNSPISALSLVEALDALSEETDIPPPSSVSIATPGTHGPKRTPPLVPPTAIERVPYKISDAVEELFWPAPEFWKGG